MTPLFFAAIDLFHNIHEAILSPLVILCFYNENFEPCWDVVCARLADIF